MNVVARGGIRLMRFAGREERQQAEGGGGDVVAGRTASLAATVPKLAAVGVFAVGVETIERPVTVIGLVERQPLQTARDGCFGRLVAAALLQHFFPRGAAAAGKTARDIN